MHIVKKLSPKTVALAYGEGQVSLPEGEDSRKLFTIIGIASSYKGGESNFGPYTAFKGQFRAIGDGQKEMISSATCFLPAAATDTLKEALDAAHKQDEGNTVEFAFDIGLVRDEKSEKGYQYTVNNLIEARPESDPLDRLIGELPEASRPALPAPRARRREKANA